MRQSTNSSAMIAASFGRKGCEPGGAGPRSPQAGIRSRDRDVGASIGAVTGLGYSRSMLPISGMIRYFVATVVLPARVGMIRCF